MTRKLLPLLLMFSLLNAPVAIAHENHDELGAGPGTVAEANAATQNAMNAALGHEGMTAGHGATADAHLAAADEKKTFGQRLVSWLGRLHTLAVHFPIAMLIGPLGVELFGLWRPNAARQEAVRIILVVGALGAVGTAFLGWFAGGFYLTDRNPLLMAHRWLGTVIALGALALIRFEARAGALPIARGSSTGASWADSRWPSRCRAGWASPSCTAVSGT